MLADLHTHSLFSFDGLPESTLENIAERAVALGLSHIAITDHCDIDCELAGLYQPFDKEKTFDAIRAVKEAYKDKLCVLVGLELGGGNHCPRETRALLDRVPYDIVLASIHNLEREKDFHYFDFSQIDDAAAHAYFDRVLQEELEVCDIEGVQVMTHLTYMDRYMHKAGKALDITPHRDGLKRLFDKLMQKQLTLELNTSTLGDGFAMPSAEILSLYRECGGTRVCLGSDAHAPAKITQHFPAACKLLLDCGFTELTLPTRNETLTYPIPKEIRNV